LDNDSEAADVAKHIEQQPGITWTRNAETAVDFGSSSDSTWADDMQRAWSTNSRASIESRYPEVWNTIRLLPSDVPGDAVAAGFVRNASQQIDQLLQSRGVSAAGIDSALAMIRITDIAIAVYAEDLNELPAQVTPEAWRDAGLGIIAVGNAGYSGLVVDFMLGGFADRAGLQAATIGDEPAYYRTVDPGLHMMMKSFGATIYFTVAGSREQAEDLMQAVITSQSSR
jgi:hypothetical protein